MQEGDEMKKVTVYFKDGTNETFYAQSSYDDTADGRMLYWGLENGDIISFPTSEIRKIVEQDVEE